jgi:hypothetical protein
MSVHYLENFLEYINKYSVDYMSAKTLDIVNDYIDNSGEIDTDDWEVCDYIRIPCDRDCYYYSDDDDNDVKGLFIWNGCRVIYPFYNGTANTGKFRKLDIAISKDGYIPDSLILYNDYYPCDVFNVKRGLKRCIGFGRIIYDDNDDCVVNDSVRINGVSSINRQSRCVTVANFGPGRFVVFFGEFNDNIRDYIKNYRPYDLDIKGVIAKYNMSIDLDEICSICSSNEDDDYLFIHPNYIGLDY